MYLSWYDYLVICVFNVWEDYKKYNYLFASRIPLPTQILNRNVDTKTSAEKF